MGNNSTSSRRSKNIFSIYLAKLFSRKGLLLFIDMSCLLATYLGVMLLRFLAYGNIAHDIWVYLCNFCIVAFFVALSRLLFRVYSNVWRYANSKAYLSMVLSDAVAGGIAYTLVYSLSHIDGIPNMNIGLWYSITVITTFNVLTLTTRFLYQQRYQRRNKKELGSSNKIAVAIVGAGQVGALLAEEISLSKKSHYRPICFIDNDPSKIGSRVSGLRVYGEDENVIKIIKDLGVQEIFIALNSISSAQARGMHDLYSKTGCKVKIYDFPIKYEENGVPESSRRVIREFNIEDLLFRDTRCIDIKTLAPYYSDKTVLVTGGGGSIGSELCRQIAKCKPKKLIILDIYENNAYEIQQQLVRKYGSKLDLAVEIASVRDVARLECVFANYRPDIVFHAAAHKHVPLMEHSSCEAIKNNVMGTYNTANLAEKYGVSKFILVSTDKAVNPTNIMGASKRMCEMVIQCRYDSKTSFAAVRFGNVLGSNGSVIPLFREQIVAGGPLTLTDKRIIRYFMTIPEASQLVMQAGAMAKSGELFVLDMGKPIKILDLAENMIRLAGLQPYIDIDIVEVGLRPGEKLYEELLMKTEELDKTENELIFIEKDSPLTRSEVEKKIEILLDAVELSKETLQAPAIKEAMMKVVPTYHEPDEVNKDAHRSEEMRSAKEMQNV